MNEFRAFVHATIVVFALLWTIQANGAGASGACKRDLNSCPLIGCAKAGTADAVINKLKRTVPSGGTPRRLTLDDFEQLQERADKLVGQHKSLTAQQRAKLKSMSVSSGSVA